MLGYPLVLVAGFLAGIYLARRLASEATGQPDDLLSHLADYLAGRASALIPSGDDILDYLGDNEPGDVGNAGAKGVGAGAGAGAGVVGASGVGGADVAGHGAGAVGAAGRDRSPQP